MARERRGERGKVGGEGEEGMSLPHEEVHSLLQLFVQCLGEVGKKLLHCLHVSNPACTVQHYKVQGEKGYIVSNPACTVQHYKVQGEKGYIVSNRCAGRHINLPPSCWLLSGSLPPTSSLTPSSFLPPPSFLLAYIVFCFSSAYLPPALPESLCNTDRQTDRCQ